jgi:hypothetical protein
MTSVTLTAERIPDVAGVQVRHRAAPRRWRALVATATALAVVATGLGCIVVGEVQADAQYRAARQSLYSTQQQMALARAQLASARGAVGLADAQVAQTAAALTDDRTALAEAQTALARTEANVRADGTTIIGLRTCLEGVERALNALSVGDARSAIAALDAVSTSCQGALSDDG